jgi:hypothetical protein
MGKDKKFGKINTRKRKTDKSQKGKPPWLYPLLYIFVLYIFVCKIIIKYDIINITNILINYYENHQGKEEIK